MLGSTVGEDNTELLHHRTEPLRVQLWPEDILFDIGYSQLYEESRHILDDRRAPHRWSYRLAQDKAEGESGVWEALEEGAPPFEEPTGEERSETWDWPQARGGLRHVPRSAADEAELDRIDELESALDDLIERDVVAYGEALRAAAIARAAELFPGLEVAIELQEGIQDRWDEWTGPEDRIVDATRWATPLPWSGIAPKDYPATSPGVDRRRRTSSRPTPPPTHRPRPNHAGSD
jgi:hypothetical protein